MAFGLGWFLVPLRARGRALPKVTLWHPQRPPPPGPGFYLTFHLSATSGRNTAGGGKEPPAQPSSRGQPPSTPLFAPLLRTPLLSAFWAQNPRFSPLSPAQSGCDVPRSAVPLQAVGVPMSPVGFGSPGSSLAPTGWARAGGAVGAPRSRPRREKHGRRQKHRVIHEVWGSSEPRCCTGTGPAEPPLHLHVSPEVTKWGCHPVTRAPGL